MLHEWRCLSCGKTFKFESDFDKHKSSDNRCLTDAEMHGRNMVLNKHGDWVTPLRERK